MLSDSHPVATATTLSTGHSTLASTTAPTAVRRGSAGTDTAQTATAYTTRKAPIARPVTGSRPSSSSSGPASAR